MRCDFVKTITTSSFLNRFYDHTLRYHYLHLGKNVLYWNLNFYWLMKKRFLLRCLLHLGIIAAHLPCQNWRNLRHCRYQDWRKSVKAKLQWISTKTVRQESTLRTHCNTGTGFNWYGFESWSESQIYSLIIPGNSCMLRIRGVGTELHS